ncbi:hypothetical protein FS837_007710, partial [Tulasnella sp. UAMH 9824]
VRRLKCSTKDNGNCLHPDLLSSIIFHHPFGSDILPNLRELHCTIENDCVVLSTLALVPSYLRKLTLLIRKDVSTDSIEQLLKLLVYRTPDLTDMVFHTTQLEEVDIGDSLRKWLMSTKLKRVTLPQFYLTNAMIQNLSRFDSLETIALDADPSIPYSDSPQKAFPIEDSGFPSLHGLHIDLPLPVGASGLGSPDLFGRLKTFEYPFKSLDLPVLK